VSAEYTIPSSRQLTKSSLESIVVAHVVAGSQLVVGCVDPKAIVVGIGPSGAGSAEYR